MSIYKITAGQGEDLVLIHGASCNHNHIQPVMDELSKKYRVTSVDLPGSGDSDWDPNNKDIHDIADQLLPALPPSAIYVCWSFGGLVTFSIASRYPKKVKRIVGIGTTPKFVSSDDWQAVPQPEFHDAFKQITSHEKMKNFFAEYYLNEFKEFNPKPEMYHQLVALLDQADKFDLDILQKQIQICGTTDLRQEFKSLRCPIDIIIGDQDEAVPLISHEQIKKLNPRTKIHLIKGAHHMPFWAYPKEFNEILAKIL